MHVTEKIKKNVLLQIISLTSNLVEQRIFIGSFVQHKLFDKNFNISINKENFFKYKYSNK